MTVFVDDSRIKARVGRLDAVWCHLFSDACDEELHELAARIGLRRSWFQEAKGLRGEPNPWRNHYDVTEPKRQAAIRAGATAITWREGAAVMTRRRDLELQKRKASAE